MGKQVRVIAAEFGQLFTLAQKHFTTCSRMVSDLRSLMQLVAAIAELLAGCGGAA
jgi:hypothetical protein